MKLFDTFLLDLALFLIFALVALKQFPVDRVATDQELVMISRETPCAAEAFRNVLTPSDDYHSKPVTISDAHKLASECAEKEKEITKIKEDNKLREQQLKALNETSHDKEVQQ